MSFTMIHTGVQTHINDASRMSTGVHSGPPEDVSRYARKDELHTPNKQQSRTCLIHTDNDDPGHSLQSAAPNTTLKNADACLQTTSSPSWLRHFKPKVKIRPYQVPVPDHVRDRFKDLKQLFDKPLYDHLTKTGLCQLPVVITLQYLGEDKEYAMPWIVILCDKSVAKSVKQWFRLPSIRSYCNPNDPGIPTFRVLVQESAPRLLGGEESVQKTDVFSGIAMEDLAPDHTLCGTLIEFNAYQSLRTLGGLIKICWQDQFAICGITASHVLHPTHFDSQLFDLSAPVGDDSSGKGDDEDPAAEMSGQLSESDGSDAFDVSDDDYELDLSNFKSSTSDEKGHARVTEDMAKLLTYHIGIVVPIATSGGQKTLDWSLIDLNKESSYRLNALIGSGTRMFTCMPTTSGCNAGLSKRVWVISGVSRTQLGTIADAPAYFHLGDSGEFTAVYSLKLLSGPGLKPGDSGSWVIDFTSGEVYGQIVASDILNNAYAIPFGDILEDVKLSLMCDSITFPTADDLQWCRDQGRRRAPGLSGSFGLIDRRRVTIPSGIQDIELPVTIGKEALATKSSLLQDSNQGNEHLLIPRIDSGVGTADPSAYVVQEFLEEYINSTILDIFLQTKPAEFGTNCHRKTRRGIHSVMMKRKLTQSEITMLQQLSRKDPGCYPLDAD